MKIFFLLFLSSFVSSYAEDKQNNSASSNYYLTISINPKTESQIGITPVLANQFFCQYSQNSEYLKPLCYKFKNGNIIISTNGDILYVQQKTIKTIIFGLWTNQKLGYFPNQLELGLHYSFKEEKSVDQNLKFTIENGETILVFDEQNFVNQ